MTIISVSLPDKLEHDLDYFIESEYFKSKSECIREALRSLSLRYQPDLFQQDTSIVAAVTALWDYHQVQIGRSLSNIVEKHENLLLNNLHMNMTKAYCLDIIIASGNSKDIFNLIKSIREIKNLEGVDFVLLCTIPEHEAH